MEIVDTEVRFDIYCKNCIHKDKKENEIPCYYCMQRSVRSYSERPEYYVSKDNNELTSQ